jgi:hypothetical protein
MHAKVIKKFGSKVADNSLKHSYKITTMQPTNNNTAFSWPALVNPAQGNFAVARDSATTGCMGAARASSSLRLSTSSFGPKAARPIRGGAPLWPLS